MTDAGASKVASTPTNFRVERAPSGRATCKLASCKTAIAKNELRIAKLSPSPFDDDKEMAAWYHVPCIFQAQLRARAWKIIAVAQLAGFDALTPTDQAEIEAAVAAAAGSGSGSGSGSGTKPKTNTKTTTSAKPPRVPAPAPAPALLPPAPKLKLMPASASTTTLAMTTTTTTPSTFLFCDFCGACDALAAEPSLTEKAAIVRRALDDAGAALAPLVVKLLLPGEDKRVYHVKDKSIGAILGRVLSLNVDAFVDLIVTTGDVAGVCVDAFGRSTVIPAATTSTLTLPEVDAMLDDFTLATRDAEQVAAWQRVLRRCSVDDLRYIVRLVKHDLRTKASVSTVLLGVDPQAKDAYRACNDLDAVVRRYRCNAAAVPAATSKAGTAASAAAAALTAPIKPMLAEAVKSAEAAVKKCPNGVRAEIKYDGERVQVHYSVDSGGGSGSVSGGSSAAAAVTARFFARSMKPVKDAKLGDVQSYIGAAFPTARSLVLDSEILLVAKDGSLIKFGSLGAHKRKGFVDATVCLFVFDIMFLNGASVMDLPLDERRKLLQRELQPVPGHIELSKQCVARNAAAVRALMREVMQRGLEGLVFKDAKSRYEPGRRHWLKMKRDYLDDGSMADTADLVVLGGYYGTGTKGGKISVFLCGVYDAASRTWKTVCKVGNGHNDAAIDRLNKDLARSFVRIDAADGGTDAADTDGGAAVPSWLDVHSTHVPHVVVTDPWAAPVWEITGAEFSKSDHHTAARISIRFPRVTKERTDKTPAQATTLAELRMLARASGANAGIVHAGAGAGAADTDADADMDTDTDASVSADTFFPSMAVDADADEEDDDAATEPEPEPEPNPAEDCSEEDEVVAAAAAAPAPASAVAAPRCKYWDKCYRTNADHLRKYAHPK
jgi:DNA ligase-3